MADRTYVEPLTRQYVEEIIRQEVERGVGKGMAVLPTVGGQTALNLAVELADSGVLEKYGVILIGAQLEAIKKAEDRLMFKDAMTRIGLDVPRSGIGQQPEGWIGLFGQAGLSGGAAAFVYAGRLGRRHCIQREELLDLLARGLDLSPVHEVLIEESVLAGRNTSWK